MKKKVMLSAIQPTNDPTIGTYLGALKNWVKMQNDYDCLFFAVDLHSITARQDPKVLRDRTYLAIATYLACGLDEKNATLFVQSHVPEHAELSWVITCHSSMGELNRMTQFKDKSSKQGENIPTGLFVYPTLMVADILLYQTNLVPVGQDQKQHVELTRDIAMRMNNAYKGDTPLFTVPEPFIPPVGAKIMSLQTPTAKMSKSDGDPHATVFLTDSDDMILKKIKKAVTDSYQPTADNESYIFFDPINRPGISNLLTIQSAITGRSIDEIVASYTGKLAGHLKLETAEIVIQAVAPIRDKTQDLLKNRDHLDAVLKRGAESARARAAKTLKTVYERLGFIPSSLL